jgi:hypothetical protein
MGSSFWYNFICVCAIGCGTVAHMKQAIANPEMELLHKAV